MKCKWFFYLVMFIFSSLKLLGKEMNEVDRRLEAMQTFRVGACCSIQWKNTTYHGQIIAVEEETFQVKVLDHSLPLGEWPILTLQREQLGQVFYEKCTTQEELIQSLKYTHTLVTPDIEEAFRAVDRAWFCPNHPYYDAAIDIGCSMCISSPHMHILALELARDLFKGATSILDVGTGSGYLAAILAQLAPRAQIYGIDYFEELVQHAEKTTQQHLPQLSNRIAFLQGIGEDGYQTGAPYDIIIVGYMCEGIPQPLFDQLKMGGRLILPMISQFRPSSYDPRLSTGNFVVIEKKEDGTPFIDYVMACSFIPSKKP